MSVRSMPSGSPASPRSASSRWMRAASASGTPVSRGIAPRIEVTPGLPARLGQPRRVQPVVLGRRAEVPQHRVALARQQHAARALVAGPLADVRARDVADVVLVEQQDARRATSRAATRAPSRAGRCGAGRSRSAAPSRPPWWRRARRCSLTRSSSHSFSLPNICAVTPASPANGVRWPAHDYTLHGLQRIQPIAGGISPPPGRRRAPPSSDHRHRMVISPCERRAGALGSATARDVAHRRSQVRRNHGSGPAGSRRLLSRGLATVLVATVGLFVASLVFASSSVSRGTLLTMLPFAVGAGDRRARPDAGRHAGRHRPVGRRRRCRSTS